jgi:carboxyl-terminal processing protease
MFMNAAKRLLKATLYISAGAFFAGVGIGIVALSRTSAQAAGDSTYENLRVFAEVMTLIQNYYVEEKSTKDLTEGAIKGLLRTLDPHSAYMDRSAYDSRKQETEGKFGGLGIEITVFDGFVAIVAPMEDTPAEKAGLLAADKIIKIDGTTTKDMEIMDAVKKMRGEVGTKVRLTILRGEGKEALPPFDVELTRATIKVHPVKFEMIDGDIGYLRIVTFSMNTALEAGEALKKFKDKKFKALVLDLRNDPGGLLKEAVEVCELFLKEGQTIVSTRGRTPEQNAVFYSHNKAPLADIPMVVLINAGSASASEIVAGALKDTKRAVLIGNRSFGKGSVQTVRELSDGSGLSLTTARYFTPAGIMIHGVGVSPDIEVKLKIPGRDDDGIEPMREKDLMESFSGGGDGRPAPKPKVPPTDKDKETSKPVAPIKQEFGPRKVFDLEKDNQLQRAVEVIKEWEVFRNVTGNKKAH